MRLAAGIGIYMLGGAGLVLTGPSDNGDEAVVTLAFVAIPLLAGMVAARWSVVGLSLLAIAPGIAFIESTSWDMTKASLYASLPMAILALAALLAVGAWIGIRVRDRRPDTSTP